MGSRVRWRKARRGGTRSGREVAERAPKAELHRYDCDHFEPFYGELPAAIAADQVQFLRSVGVVSSAAPTAAA
jgi:hypothetical protein